LLLLKTCCKRSNRQVSLRKRAWNYMFTLEWPVVQAKFAPNAFCK